MEATCSVLGGHPVKGEGSRYSKGELRSWEVEVVEMGGEIVEMVEMGGEVVERVVEMGEGSGDGRG